MMEQSCGHRVIPNLHLHPLTGLPVEVGFECVDCNLADDGQWVLNNCGEHVYVVYGATPLRTYRLRWDA